MKISQKRKIPKSHKQVFWILFIVNKDYLFRVLWTFFNVFQHLAAKLLQDQYALNMAGA